MDHMRAFWDSLSLYLILGISLCVVLKISLTSLSSSSSYMGIQSYWSSEHCFLIQYSIPVYVVMSFLLRMYRQQMQCHWLCTVLVWYQNFSFPSGLRLESSFSLNCFSRVPLLIPQMKHLVLLSDSIVFLWSLSWAKVSITIPETMLLKSSSMITMQRRSARNLVNLKSLCFSPISPEVQRLITQSLRMVHLSSSFSQIRGRQRLYQMEIMLKTQTKARMRRETTRSWRRLEVMAWITFFRIFSLVTMSKMSMEYHSSPTKYPIKLKRMKKNRMEQIQLQFLNISSTQERISLYSSRLSLSILERSYLILSSPFSLSSRSMGIRYFRVHQMNTKYTEKKRWNTQRIFTIPLMMGLSMVFNICIFPFTSTKTTEVNRMQRLTIMVVRARMWSLIESRSWVFKDSLSSTLKFQSIRLLISEDFTKKSVILSICVSLLMFSTTSTLVSSDSCLNMGRSGKYRYWFLFWNTTSMCLSFFGNS